MQLLPRSDDDDDDDDDDDNGEKQCWTIGQNLFQSFGNKKPGFVFKNRELFDA